jgi:hypothetical protein
VSLVVAETRGAVGLARLNRPEARNALCAALSGYAFLEERRPEFRGR